MQRPATNTKWRRRYMDFVLETGSDGLITIFDANAKPISTDMRFVEAETAIWFLRHWREAQGLTKVLVRRAKRERSTTSERRRANVGLKPRA